jgi:hypothetical protein
VIVLTWLPSMAETAHVKSRSAQGQSRRRRRHRTKVLAINTLLALGSVAVGCRAPAEPPRVSASKQAVDVSPQWYGPDGPVAPPGSAPIAAPSVSAPGGLTAAASSAPAPPAAPPGAGYGEYRPSADSRVIYVSSKGNDANDGATPERPVATALRGLSLLRDHYPDQLLFRRGDVFKGEWGVWKLSGRSPAERMVIGAYGQGERPRFEFRGIMMQTHGGSGVPRTDNLAFVSLHFLGLTDNPPGKQVAGPTCIFWMRPSSDVAVEDVRFERCAVGLQSEDPEKIERWRFYRSLFLDSFSLDGRHAQGIYLSRVKATSIEECIFDRCGWHPKERTGVPTIFNHCIYWQKHGLSDGVVRGNIVMRGSSHGVQMRSGGKVDDNLFVRNGIGGFVAEDTDLIPVTGEAVGNVFSEGEDILPREGHPGDLHRGWGFELLAKPGNVNYSFVMRDNIFSHCRATDPASCRTAPSAVARSQISGNLVWKWPGKPGELQQSPGPFVDPDRTVATYNASLGGKNSFEAFADEVRKQSKTNWRKQYSAEAVIAYFRAGFAKKAATTTAEPTKK